MSLWTPPRTWSVGEKVRAAFLNAIRDQLLYLHGPPRLALRRTEDLTLTPGDHVVVPWDTPLVDDGGWWDPGSPEVAVVPEDGYFGIWYSTLFDTNTDGDRQTRIVRDGDELRGMRNPATTHSEWTLSVATNVEQGTPLTFDARSTAPDPVELLSRTSPTTRSPVVVAIRLAPPLPGA